MICRMAFSGKHFVNTLIVKTRDLMYTKNLVRSLKPWCSKTWESSQRWKTVQVYKCSYCGKGFINPDKVKRHKVIHTGAMDFGCSICGKTFISVWASCGPPVCWLWLRPDGPSCGPPGRGCCCQPDSPSCGPPGGGCCCRHDSPSCGPFMYSFMPDFLAEPVTTFLTWIWWSLRWLAYKDSRVIILSQ